VARVWYLRAGAIVGVAMLVAGLMFDNTWVMAAGAIIIPLNLVESFQMQTQDHSEESFMGYDFSQGYTSLEQSHSDDDENDQRPGVLARWKAQREEEKRQKQEEEDRDMERQLDLLLEKLHTHGDSALTNSEKRRLQDISERLRERGRSS